MPTITQIIITAYWWFCLAIFVIYLPRISFYFFPFKKQKRLKNLTKNKIAIIVPARNESAVIKSCLTSLSKQTYDQDYFDIWVVVEDANDPTVEIAKTFPNTKISIIANQKCKGDALDGVLKEILQKDPQLYDAYLIVDADNLAAYNLIEEMNNALSTDAQIVCGKKLVKNYLSQKRQDRTFVVNSMQLLWVCIDELGNRARSALKLPITIIGTGLMVRSDVIKENNGWPYRTLTEDYEMTADSIVKGWRSFYYSHAKVYTEEALDFKTNRMRKVRWLRGQIKSRKLYRKAILGKIFKRKTTICNLGFLFSTYPMFAFFAVSILLTIFGGVMVVLSLINQIIPLYLALQVMLIPLGMMYISFFTFGLIALMANNKNMKISFLEKVFLLLFNPIYALGWLGIYLKAHLVKHQDNSWQPTKRIQTK